MKGAVITEDWELKINEEWGKEVIRAEDAIQKEVVHKSAFKKDLEIPRGSLRSDGIYVIKYELLQDIRETPLLEDDIYHRADEPMSYGFGKKSHEIPEYIEVAVTHSEKRSSGAIEQGRWGEPRVGNW